MRTTSTLILDSIAVVGFLFVAVAPFFDKRDRAPWAKLLLIVTGSIGFISFAGEMILNFHHFGFAPHTGHLLYKLHVMTDGWLVGWLSALLLSGELLGKKAESSNEQCSGA